ncbi:uncharacterized protein A4U43_C08F21730, partial [Asparagus officinalis]
MLDPSGVQSLSLRTEQANYKSSNMKEDLPGYEKDIQVEDTSLIAENKKQNLKSVQKRVTPIPKKNCKRKCIVPQPFSLSTEKRISKMISSLQRFTPSLSRSLSF